MSKIVYLEDIVDELTEEFGIDRKQVEEICKLNIKYIHKLTKNPEVISISLPKLGVLHFNSMRARNSYKRSTAFKKYRDIVGSQIDIVSDTVVDEKDLVHNRRSYYSAIRKIFFKDKEKRFKSTKAEVYKKLEIKQNKINK